MVGAQSIVFELRFECLINMESSGARRSARKRGLSLKAELNESFNVKVAVTPLKTPGKKRGRGKGR